jgi:hypothetical protein
MHDVGLFLDDVGLFYEHLVYFINIWSIIRPFDLFYGHLVHFVVIWYIFSPVGILNQEKSGNPAYRVSMFKSEYSIT